MARSGCLLPVFAALILCSVLSCGPQTKPEAVVANEVIAGLDTFNNVVEKELLPLIHSANNKALHASFLKARLAYKQVEWAVAYFTQRQERLINGAPLPEVEGNGQVLQAGGLQVIEAELFPAVVSSSKEQLKHDLKQILLAVSQSKLYFKHIHLLDWQIWEAARMEVFRVQTLGLSGFDSPLAQNSIPEAAAALQGLKRLMQTYGPDNLPPALAGLFWHSEAYLRSHPDFNSFDRADFITRLATPLSEVLWAQQVKTGIKPLHYNRLLRQNAASLFSEDAFNPAAFAADGGEKQNPAKINLGERLFHEPMLSGAVIRSCASCHQPEKAFSDGLAVNEAAGGNTPLKRRTPTLLNAALQPAQFADMRVITLEQQVADVVTNPMEMRGSLLIASARLAANAAYAKSFATVFNTGTDSAVTPARIANALAAYVRNLSLLNSRFDAYMRGDKTSMSSQEVAGFNLFMGKARCGTCHYMPLFNGALPPYYERMDAEVIGVPDRHKHLDKDMGQYGIVAAQHLAHAFKTPTVRNAARMAYFMHNGVFSSLEQVLDFYNKGGGAGIGLSIPNQTLSSAPLHLSKPECTAIIAFIGSLDSRVPANSKNFKN